MCLTKSPTSNIQSPSSICPHRLRRTGHKTIRSYSIRRPTFWGLLRQSSPRLHRVRFSFLLNYLALLLLVSTTTSTFVALLFTVSVCPTLSVVSVDSQPVTFFLGLFLFLFVLLLLSFGRHCNLHSSLLMFIV